VLVTFRTTFNSEPTTETVLQDVQILALDQKTSPDPQGKPTTANVVTLLVNPDDAEKAVLAAAQGSVHFVLRNGTDHDHVSEKPIVLNGKAEELEPKHATGARRVVVASEPAVKPYVIETVQGNKHSTETFQ
jgi:pilus assembly protein CpaB